MISAISLTSFWYHQFYSVLGKINDQWIKYGNIIDCSDGYNLLPVKCKLSSVNLYIKTRTMSIHSSPPSSTFHLLMLPAWQLICFLFVHPAICHGLHPLPFILFILSAYVVHPSVHPSHQNHHQSVRQPVSVIPLHISPISINLF